MRSILPEQSPALNAGLPRGSVLTWDDNAQRQAWPGETPPPGAMWRLGNVSDGRDPRDLRDAVKPVVLAKRQETLGFGGERADGGLRLGFAVEDPVFVAARADLGALRGVGGPHGGGQRRVKLLGQPVHLGHG